MVLVSKVQEIAVNTPGAPDVMAVFEDFPPALRGRLLTLRHLILAAAAETDGVGPLIETLKWGQPSYLPAKPRIGGTVRIGTLRARRSDGAVFFHCQTRLIETFRELYPDAFSYAGNRAIIVPADRPIPEAAFRHCVALALTYHLWK